MNRRPIKFSKPSTSFGGTRGAPTGNYPRPTVNSTTGGDATTLRDVPIKKWDSSDTRYNQNRNTRSGTGIKNTGTIRRRQDPVPFQSQRQREWAFRNQLKGDFPSMDLTRGNADKRFGFGRSVQPVNPEITPANPNNPIWRRRIGYGTQNPINQNSNDGYGNRYGYSEQGGVQRYLPNNTHPALQGSVNPQPPQQQNNMSNNSMLQMLMLASMLGGGGMGYAPQSQPLPVGYGTAQPPMMLGGVGQQIPFNQANSSGVLNSFFPSMQLLNRGY